MAQLCMLTSSYTSSLVMQGMKDMYTNGKFLDLEIFDLKGGSVYANTVVLAAVSPVLKSHLGGQGETNPKIQRLCFRDINVEEWKIILDFIYLGEVIVGLEQIPRLTEIVKSLGIEELQELCRLSSSQVTSDPDNQNETTTTTTNTGDAQQLAPRTEQIVVQTQPPEEQSQEIVMSARFPQPSVNPGRGTQCPYTKKGTLAKHRLTPLAKGTITGPFGSVQISTEQVESEQLMRDINRVFYGKGLSDDENDDGGETAAKKRKIDESDKDTQINVKIESGTANENESNNAVSKETNEESQQFVLISESGEVLPLQDHQKEMLLKETMQENSSSSKELSNKSNTNNVKQVIEQTAKTPGRRYYKCSKCNLAFPFGPKLRRHENEHREVEKSKQATGRFKCDTCNRAFESIKSLKFHKRLICTPRNNCKFCTDKFHFRYQLDQHILEKHPSESKTYFGPPVKCKSCDETFASESLRSQHRSYAHRGNKDAKNDADNDNENTCEYCGEKCKDQKQLQVHVKTAHTPADCTYCGERVENRNALIDHLRDCDNAPSGAADALVKKTESTGKGRGGNRSNQPMYCPHCQASFPSKSALVQHNDEEHGGQDMTYCTTCQRKFQSIRAFRTHMMRHYGIRPVSCPLCDRKFVEKRDMQKHVDNVHKSERPYSCPHCEWTFKDVSALYMHAKRRHNVILSKIQANRTNTDNVGILAESFNDTDLVEALLIECSTKHTMESTRCVICGARFQSRGGLYAHGSHKHQRDFKAILHDAMSRRGLQFPKAIEESSTNNTIISGGTIVLDPNEINTSAIQRVIDFDEPVIAESDLVDLKDSIVGVITHEDLVQDLNSQISLDNGTESLVKCPLCGEMHVGREGIVKHGKEDHNLNFEMFLEGFDGVEVKGEQE